MNLKSITCHNHSKVNNSILLRYKWKYGYAAYVLAVKNFPLNFVLLQKSESEHKESIFI